MGVVNIFCEVPYLYRTKADMNWGGIDYVKLMNRVRDETGCSRIGRSTAVVKRGPRQQRFLGALESFGFDIALGDHVNGNDEILPEWDQLCYEESLKLLRDGPEWVAFFGESVVIADTACWAINNWNTNVLFAAFSSNDLLDMEADLTGDSHAEGELKTLLITEDLCSR
jgi:hypothetical protein